MANGSDIKITSVSPLLHNKIVESANKEGKQLAPFCREIIANHVFNEKTPNELNEHPFLQQIVTLLKIGGAFALLLFIILLIFAGIIAVNYLKQTGGL